MAVKWVMVRAWTLACVFHVGKVRAVFFVDRRYVDETAILGRRWWRYACVSFDVFSMAI